MIMVARENRGEETAGKSSGRSVLFCSGGQKGEQVVVVVVVVVG